MIALVLFALAAPPAEGWPAVIERPVGVAKPIFVGLVDRVELLDVSATHAMLKVVHRLEGDGEDGRMPVDCGYAGMKADPLAGVSLVVFELASGVHQEFVVYAPALQASECLDHAASTKALDAAKARATALKLDVARKPAPLPSGTLARPWGSATLAMRAQVEVFDEDPMGVVTWTIGVGDHVLYRSKHEFSRMMAGGAKAAEAVFWEAPGGVVALEDIQYFSGRGGTGHGLRLTPVLQVP